MKKPVPAVHLTVSLTALWLAGCGGAEPYGPPAGLEPVVAEAAPAASVEAPPVREADVPLAERWRSPFAVASAGRIAPPEPRPVAVLGADPSIQPVNGGQTTGPASAGTPSSGGNAPVAGSASAAGTSSSAGNGTPVGNTSGTANPSPAPSAANTAPASNASQAGNPSSTGNLTSAPSAPPPTNTPSAATPTPPAAAGGVSSGAGVERAPSAPPAVSAAGSTASATAPSPPRPPAPPAESVTSVRAHEVQRGDTWYGIAQRYGVPPRELAAANPGVDPERIRIGQVLRIPLAAEAAPSRSHRVGPGDTLWGIARRYDVSVEDIRRANRMTDDRVRLNQTLVIP